MPEVITYPPSINTDFDKLCAVYSLAEQMRLEHNRQGDKARSDPEKYVKTGKWAQYTKIFRQKYAQLAREKLRLKELIRKANYSYEAWKKLSFEDRERAHVELFGDRVALKVLPTEATTHLLEELELIDLDTVFDGSPLDPLEDFTTYDYADPGNDLTITANKITFDALPANVTAYIRREHTISGDFEHLHAFNVDLGSGAYAKVVLWAISDGYDTWNDMESNHSGFGLYDYTTSSGVAHYVYFYDCENASYEADWSTSGTVTRYCTIWRGGSDAHCSLYTDSDRTNLEATLDISPGTASYSHVYGLASCGSADSATKSGYSENLDLQEVTEKSSSDSGSGVDSKASGNPIAAIAKSDTGTGSEEPPTQTATFSKTESGSGVEQSLLTLLLSSSESGSGAEAVVYLLSELLKGDSGYGVEGISGRDLVLPDSGAGVDSLLALLAAVLGSEAGSGVEWSSLSIIIEKFSSETGSGAEAAALITLLVSGDGGTGSDLGRLPMKTILGSDGGGGCDALKALLGTAGSDVRLRDRQGQVRMPSKGVNL